MLPEDAITLVQRWAEARTPEEFQDRMRVEVEVEPGALTIVECSLMRDLSGQPDWLRVPSARLNFSSENRKWTLHCFDSDSNPVLYPYRQPTAKLQTLLDEIDEDPTCIFWG